LWAIDEIHFKDVWDALAALSWYQIAFLVIFNTFIILLLTSRWWLVLRAQGHRIPFLTMSGYRLAAFAVSYFTPGTQFGGEPLQVYFPKKRFRISGENATAAVSLDKIFELLANFSFLAIGFTLIVKDKLFSWLNPLFISPFIVVLISFPLLYLIALRLGRLPLGWLTAKLSVRIVENIKINRYVPTICRIEHQISSLLQLKPLLIIGMSLLSVLIWILMICEYWLTLKFLGANLNLSQAVIALTAARLAFLTPLPGGMGALEASQVLVLEALGINPAIGFSVSLLIRARDIFFGVLGLWVGAIVYRRMSGDIHPSEQRSLFLLSSKESVNS
jgi:uncharacterized protein (TIRG00374 family)